MGHRQENDSPGSRGARVTGDISVADEHIATEISIRVLALQREAQRAVHGNTIALRPGRPHRTFAHTSAVASPVSADWDSYTGVLTVRAGVT